MKLHELKAGDSIYVLVPYKDNNDFVDYRIEETSLIRCSREDSALGQFVHVKFKYTNYYGNRKTIDTKIFETKWNEDFMTQTLYSQSFDERTNKIYWSSDKEYLKQLYKNLFTYWVWELEERIEYQKRQVEAYNEKLISNNIEEYKYTLEKVPKDYI